MADGFMRDDGGRTGAGFKGIAGDCVARAVAIASERPYAEVYAALSAGQGSQRASKRTKRRTASARNGVNTTRKWFKDYMVGLGFAWVPTMAIGAGCRVHLDAAELPEGRLVVVVSGHYTTMIDGVIHDTYDPRREGAWYSEPDTGQALKAGQTRNINGVWTQSGGRCVYGYWMLGTPASKVAA